MAGADRLTTWAEDGFYGDDIVLRESSAYQRMVVTSGGAGVRLFLNGNLQFHSRDEYRYHEALVHPALAAHGAPRRVLVLGGGDGMAVREVLRHPSVEQVTLVELDPHMTRLFAAQPLLRRSTAARWPTQAAVVNADAFTWLEAPPWPGTTFDVIVVDFPDPTNFSIGKLYTTSFYQLLDQALAAERLHGGADHLAAGGAPQLLDRGGHAGGRGPAHHALPRPRAQLRRMGLRDRRPPALAHARAGAARRACVS
jgi:spermidine synthase